MSASAVLRIEEAFQLPAPPRTASPSAGELAAGELAGALAEIVERYERDLRGWSKTMTGFIGSAERTITDARDRGDITIEQATDIMRDVLPKVIGSCEAIIEEMDRALPVESRPDSVQTLSTMSRNMRRQVLRQMRRFDELQKAQRDVVVDAYYGLRALASEYGVQASKAFDDGPAMAAHLRALLD